MDSLCMIMEVHLMLQRHSTNIAPDPISFVDMDKCFRLKCLVGSPGLANEYTRFSNGKPASPKHTKQMVGLFSVNTSNIAALSACFSTSAAASCVHASLA